MVEGVVQGNFYLLKAVPVGVVKLGIGAPVVSTVLEELIALGVSRFISIGTAGALQKDARVGQIIVCDSAVRDEGVSHHYLAPSKLVYPSRELTECLVQNLEQQGLPLQVGPTWTIDTPYRETVDEARHYQQEGVLTVEMEASAFFAVAEHRGVEVASAFVVSDLLGELIWEPQFKSGEASLALQQLYEVAKSTLASS